MFFFKYIFKAYYLNVNILKIFCYLCTFNSKYIAKNGDKHILEKFHVSSKRKNLNSLFTDKYLTPKSIHKESLNVKLPKLIFAFY